MKVKVIKVVNTNFQIENQEMDIKELDGVSVGSVVKLFNKEYQVVQIGEIITLTERNKDNPSLLVFQKVYDNSKYINDYKLIDDGVVRIYKDKKLVEVLKPVSMNALFNYFKYHYKEKVIKQISDNEYVFINGYKLYGSHSHENIKEGRYHYSFKVKNYNSLSEMMEK